MITPLELGQLQSKLKEYEGCIEHMYLDTNGFVTVGVGHLIANADQAARLSFWTIASSTLATTEEKKDEYALVAKQPKGKAASFYRKNTALYLKQVDIDALTKQHIEGFERELKVIYASGPFSPGFERFPSEVRLALFDMVFNLGATKLRSAYPSFNAAVGKQDWAIAAKHCNRNGISVTRNAYVKALLQKAAEGGK